MAEIENSRRDAVSDAVQRVSDAVPQSLEDGYEQAREIGDKGLEYLGHLSEDLSELVRREPLIAVGAAFLVGYLAARILRRL
jgi:hypothetical protein